MFCKLKNNNFSGESLRLEKLYLIEWCLALGPILNLNLCRKQPPVLIAKVKEIWKDFVVLAGVKLDEEGPVDNRPLTY